MTPATAESDSPTPVTLDHSVLRSFHALCADDESGVIEELVDVYLDSTPRQLESLRGAIAAHDVPGAVGTLHSMKGSAATIGAVRLAKLCRQVIDTENAQHKYGLRLPGVQIEPAHGSRHRHQCLQQLALFDLPQRFAEETPPGAAIDPASGEASMVAR